MKVAIVGLGEISDCHIKALRDNPEFEIVGGTDLNPKLKQKLPDTAKFYDTFEALINDSEVESVVLLIPSGTVKTKLSRQIIEAGRNLITEKPAVSNTEEVKELQRLARQNNVFIHGAFHSRFSPTAREIKRLLDSDQYSRTGITRIEIWADSPHIVNWEIKGKSSEDTSLHGEGPNILSEALLYVPAIEINSAEFVRYSQALSEVHTQMVGKTPSGEFHGTTSWIRGIKQKGVRISFSDGRELIALHTEQKLFNEKGKLIFDGKESYPQKTPGMQEEYDELYRQLGENILDHKADNLELVEDVVLLTDRVGRLMTEIPHEVRREVFIPKA